jgi:hypothetical protein
MTAKALGAIAQQVTRPRIPQTSDAIAMPEVLSCPAA